MDVEEPDFLPVVALESSVVYVHVRVETIV